MKQNNTFPSIPNNSTGTNSNIESNLIGIMLLIFIGFLIILSYKVCNKKNRYEKI